jgi:hypothetical protein
MLCVELTQEGTVITGNRIKTMASMKPAPAPADDNAPVAPADEDTDHR